jgi:metallophosphoesterase (TIGR00282 family)
MNILFVGDVVGKGGRMALRELMPVLRREFNAGFCIANGENAAAGNGITAKCFLDMISVVDVVTLGDHVWDQKGFDLEINQCRSLLRPANLHRCQPGRGWGVFRNPGGGDVAIISLQGKVFMRESAACPFETIEDVLAKIPKTATCIIVDFHAEATSEKAAMAHYLDGRVTAVLGTHTHVQTADAKILPGGTAFVSDVGMTGAEYSVLGREVSAVVEKFSRGMPRKLPVVEKGIIRIDAVVLGYDHVTGRADSIRTISRTTDVK